MTFDIQAALTEVQTKTHVQIERETAYKWASRAIACYILTQQADDQDPLRWFLDAEDFRHEAVEHAAMSEDNGATLKRVEGEMMPHRFAAQAVLGM